MKIVILDGYAANPGDLDYHLLEQLGEVVVYPRTSDEEKVERAKDADIILLNKVQMDAETLAQLPNLKYIGIQATGFNVVDIKAAKEQGRRGVVLTCKEKLVHYYAKFGFVDEGISGSTHGNVVWHQMRVSFASCCLSK